MQVISPLRTSVYLYDELVGGNDSYLNLLKEMPTNAQHFLPDRRGGKLKQGPSQSMMRRIFYISDAVYWSFSLKK